MLALLLATALAASPALLDDLKKVSPVLECVGQTADGTYFAWFGYDSKNTREITIPVGSGSTGDGGYRNEFKGGADRGQPTQFLPGRQQHVFRITFDAPHDTWTLRAPGESTKTATAGANAAADDCAYGRQGADLSLSASVSDPAPEVGDVVTATVRVRNGGPQTPRSVSVEIGNVPGSVTLVDGDVSSGSISGDTWTLDSWALGDGDSETLTVTFRVDAAEAAAVAFEVSSSSLSDPDSTPGDGLGDDWALVAITPPSSSPGGDGGLESNGSLATLLGRRSVERSQAEALAARTGQRTALVPLAVAPASRTMRGSDLDLAALLPVEGPGGLTGYVSTPEDLLQITNATALLAADYHQPDGDRAGVALAVLTPAGEIYDHTKAICDRVKGSRLESVRRVEVDGAEFILLHIARPDGSVDFAISFVAYPNGAGPLGDGYAVDSRFRAEEYAIAQGFSDDVLNVQAWASTPDLAAALVAEILDGLALQADADYRNVGAGAPAVPSVFVRAGAYAPGALTLDVANTTGAPVAVTLSGSMAAVEEGARAPFERSLAVPAEGLRTTVPVDALFDIGFSVVPEGAETPSDYVYLADGVWTFASGAPSDALDYAVAAGGVAPTHNVRPVERAARLAGVAAEWAGLFRGLQPGARPVDLTAFDALVFEARGSGRFQVVLEQTETAGLEPYHAWIDLDGDARTVRIPFADLARGGAAGGFTAEGVKLLAFYTYAEGGAPTPFEIDVRDVRFENARSVAAEGAPAAALGLAVAPNPSRRAARVTLALPAAATATVDVLDPLGRRVATLAADRAFAAGTHTLAMPDALAAGTYVVRLRAGAEVRALPVTRL